MTAFIRAGGGPARQRALIPMKAHAIPNHPVSGLNRPGFSRTFVRKNLAIRRLDGLGRVAWIVSFRIFKIASTPKAGFRFRPRFERC
ncbi:hypothetical protein [Beijerinckia sp. L45]|uniref:hypothetical protein n=1 Tax=Beijerinckia sp. L45 TaxID=1641855 RepID=UPI0015765EAE|nr:hypothetical protein [Beijerinckia sp. L45]